MKAATSNILKKCGITADLKGWSYVGRAIEMVIDNWDTIHHITKELYPSVAKEFNTTSSRVERAIRHAIETGFEKASYSDISVIFGNTVDPNKGKVTNSAFIAIVADALIHEGEA